MRTNIIRWSDTHEYKLLNKGNYLRKIKWKQRL